MICIIYDYVIYDDKIMIDVCIICDNGVYAVCTIMMIDVYIICQTMHIVSCAIYTTSRIDLCKIDLYVIYDDKIIAAQEIGIRQSLESDAAVSTKLRG